MFQIANRKREQKTKKPLASNTTPFGVLGRHPSTLYVNLRESVVVELVVVVVVVVVVGKRMLTMNT